MALPIAAAMAIGALAGAGSEGLGLLFQELVNRKDLKAQRAEFRRTKQKVEDGRFGPSALALASREAKMRSDVRSAQELGRNEFERQAAALGSAGGADLQRVRSTHARNQTAAGLAGSQKIAEDAREEARVDELTTRQSLEDMRAQRRAKAAAVANSLIQGAMSGASIGGGMYTQNKLANALSETAVDEAGRKMSTPRPITVAPYQLPPAGQIDTTALSGMTDEQYMALLKQLGLL